MNEIGEIFKQSNELIKNPAISGTIGGLFSWLKSKIKSKSAIEKIELIEQNKHNEETITSLKGNLETIFEEKTELQNQLAEKLEEVRKLMKEEGFNISKTNTATTEGNNNTILQDINTKGNITINK